MSETYTPPPPPPPTSYGGGPAPSPGAQIPNYLVQSILITLCCCLPIGIVAIVFSAQVNSKLAAGDLAGAQEASQKAKMFCWIGLALGIVGWIIGIVLNGAVFMNAIHQAQQAG